MEEADRLYEFLEDQFDDSLRSVGSYSTDSREFVFVRDDIESEYGSGDLDRVFRDARLEALDQNHQESLYTHGELQATMRIFEQATELHIALTETEGLVAAIDAGAVDGARDLIDSALSSIQS